MFGLKKQVRLRIYLNIFSLSFTTFLSNSFKHDFGQVKKRERERESRVWKYYAQGRRET
jgi:hypothetical protein